MRTIAQRLTDSDPSLIVFRWALQAGIAVLFASGSEKRISWAGIEVISRPFLPLLPGEMSRMASLDGFHAVDHDDYIINKHASTDTWPDNIPEALSSSRYEDARAELATKGFAVLRNALPQSTLASLRYFTALKAGVDAASLGLASAIPLSAAGEYRIDQSPPRARGFLFPVLAAIQALAMRILEVSTVNLLLANLLVRGKLPEHKDHFIGTHQGAAYWFHNEGMRPPGLTQSTLDDFIGDTVMFWVPLTSNAIAYAPGTHKPGLFNGGATPPSDWLETVLAEPGDVTFHSGYVIHGPVAPELLAGGRDRALFHFECSFLRGHWARGPHVLPHRALDNASNWNLYANSRLQDRARKR